MLKNISRLYQTIKHLRLKQLFYQLYYKFYPLKVFSLGYSCGCSGWLFLSPQVTSPSMLDKDRVIYLNVERNISSTDCWNNVGHEKLWLYNLHYFDDLNAIGSDNRLEWHLNLVKRWIGENPPMIGNGWEPYPISLRLVNWIKWYNRTEQSSPEIITSIALQAEVLSRRLEYHILGNHLFANAKALVFAGAFLKGDLAERYLKIGLDILTREIPEQFLSDGGHFERSPMYHCIMLWDLLELVYLSDISDNIQLTKAAIEWRKVAVSALFYMRAITHPDGEISFFNDCSIGVSVTPQAILDFAEILNIKTYTLEENTSIITLAESGYSRLSDFNQTVLFDHARVGPNYQPGHAHADSLSFEWSVGIQRVLVNSGTSVYGVGPERLRQRQTAAHNTVVVDNVDSSDVWGGFRVGRRAHCYLNDVGYDGYACWIDAKHDGYHCLPGKVTHHRYLRIEKESLIIKDRLIGQWKNAQAFFHLHPSVSVSEMDGLIYLTLPDGARWLVQANVTIQIHESTWHPRFGMSIENKKMVLNFNDSEQYIKFTCIKMS